ELIPRSEPAATILITAQDMFFASKSYRNVAELVGDFRQAMSEVEGMTIERGPSEMKVADHLLYRVDFSGVGLYRATFTTEIRCHAVSFNLTARDPMLLADLALSVNKMSAAGQRSAAFPAPYCIENYAVPENLLRRVEPAPIGPRFAA